MSASIARYLKDFSVPEPVVTAATTHFDDAFGDDLAPLDFSDFPQETSHDNEATLKASFDEGYETASQELREIHQTELRALNEAHQAEIEALKAQFHLEISTTIESRFTAIVEDLSRKLADQVTEVLIPVLGSALAEKAASDLADKVTSLFDEPDGIALIVRGPIEMFNTFQEKIGQGGFTVRHIETNDIDLSVEFEDTVMVTRLSAWAEATRSLGS